MGQLTDKGFVIERLDNIITQLEDGFREIYGADINIDPDTPDGQVIGIMAQVKADIEELADSIYKALDPDLASGVWLEQRVAYAGLIRRQSSYSYLKVKCTGQIGTVIPINSMVEDEKRQRWLTTESIVINNTGEAYTALRSDLKGSFSLDNERPLEMMTRIIGWETVNVVENAVVGNDEESDFQLRQRFFKSRAMAAKNSSDGIIASIFQLDTVLDVECLENYTNVTDKNGVPPHSINVIVEGGNEKSIAQIIRDKKTAGTGMLGAIDVFLPNAKGRMIPYRFDRPQSVFIQIYLEIRRQENYSLIDTEAIIDSLSTVRFNIGETIFYSRLFTPINQTKGFWVEKMLIGKKGEALSESNIEISPRELARIAPENIEIITL